MNGKQGCRLSRLSRLKTRTVPVSAAATPGVRFTEKTPTLNETKSATKEDVDELIFDVDRA
jgi:hypothetical protein